MATNVINIRERGHLAEAPADNAPKKSVAKSYVPANPGWRKESAANRKAVIENAVNSAAHRNATNENSILKNAANSATSAGKMRMLGALHAAVFTANSFTGAHSTVTRATSALHVSAIPALDLFAGIPQSALTQVCIPQSMASGRMAILCSLLSQATNREEVCALIDAGDSFDANSAAMAGADLSRLLWVRCGKKPATAPGINPSFRPHAEHNFADNPLQCVTNSHSTPDNHSFLFQHYGNNSHPSLDGKPPGLDGKFSFRSRQQGPDANTTVSAPKTDKQKASGRENPVAQTEQNAGKANTRHINAGERKNVQPQIRNVEMHCSHSEIRSGEARRTHPAIRSASARLLQPIEQAFKAADILIQNGGFSLIVIDLGEIDERLVRKIPLTTWFRFSRVIERQPTALVVFATYPAAQSCAALTLHIKNAAARWSATPRDSKSAAASHAKFLSGLTCEVELGRVRGKLRRPVQGAGSEVNERIFSAIPIWK